MHLLEKYSLSVGAKIGEPFVDQHFFPIPEERYIVFSIDKYNYLHWQAVIFFSREYLKSLNIKTVQIGPKDAPKIGCDINLSGNITINQSEFIIKNAKMFVGECGLMAHISCFFGVPSIVLFGSNQIKHIEPFWKPKIYEPIVPQEKEEVKSITPQSIKQSLKLIKPETVYNKIFEILEEDVKKYKTLFFGERYVNSVTDIKPDDYVENIPSGHINIRADKGFKNKIIESILLRKRCELTISEKIDVNSNILKNASSINYVSEEFDEDLLNQIKKTGVKYILICPNKIKISEQRFKYFDEEIHLWDIQEYTNQKKMEENINLSSIKILSNKKVLVGEKVFSSWWEESGKEEDLWIDKDWILAYTDVV